MGSKVPTPAPDARPDALPSTPAPPPVRRRDRPTLADLKPDARNANRHTERGTGLIEKSLRDCGAGRSILTDRNGVVIAGNGVLESWAGFVDPEQIIVVPTDGTRLVVVQRTDLDLADAGDKQARQLAILDNRTSQVGLDWDGKVLAELATDYGLLSEDIGFSDAEFNAAYFAAAGGTDETAPAAKALKVCPHCGGELTK